MDPAECLTRIKTRVAQIRAFQEEEATNWRRGIPEDIADVAQELVDDVENLDQWLTKGGFVPNQWKPRPPVAPLPQTGE